MNRNRVFLIYGDSNTYGYDPADYFESRYPAKDRWTEILQKYMGDCWKILPEGMNGRRLPDIPYDHSRLVQLTGKLSANDIFAIMLGTNDILLTMNPDAETAVRKMDDFLSFLRTDAPIDPRNILVIAPPHIGNEHIKNALYQQYFRESVKMNAGFRELAAYHRTMFLDAADWGISLSCDHVHFSESGHRQFALKMASFLESLSKEP